jgi:hypothetical protein
MEEKLVKLGLSLMAQTFTIQIATIVVALLTASPSSVANWMTRMLQQFKSLIIA